MFIGLSLGATAAVAQSIQLTAEQQRMLDSLPPAQRQQALAAIRQFENEARAQQGGFSTLNEDASAMVPEPVDLMPQDLAFEDIEPVADPGSTLIIELKVSADAPLEAREEIDSDSALGDLRGVQVYVVNDDGLIELPGVVTVPVSGLTAEEIGLRLDAEPALRAFDATVNVLEPVRTGAAALEPFGYEVFEALDARFDPVMSGPVPPDYVLGPGDSIRVQLFGNVNGIYEFEVGRDGVLNLPEIGPVTVAGLPFSEFRTDLNRRVNEMLIGTQVSTTMGQLRTIRVFVLGDANRPGSYVVSSLATISSAIYAAGGISEIGSLRDIQLKRDGEIVTRFDLYDLLLRGDTSDNLRLQPGDVIFVPPIGDQVSVSGAVKRPAIYETDGQASIAEVVRLAGGLTSDAYPEGARVERIGSGAGRVVISLDADSAEARSTAARGGDAVYIPEVLPEYQETVELIGFAYRPGPYQWRPGMRLTDVLGSLSALKPGADKNYVLVRHEEPGGRRVSVDSTDLDAALRNPASDRNLELRPRDKIYVFSLEYGRQRIIQPLLDELELQSRFGEPNPVVMVSGRVRAPGTYPLEPGMRIGDLIRAAGDLSEEAYAVKAELVRYETVDGEYRSTQIVDVNLAAILRGDESANVPLTEQDTLRISALPEWDTLWVVTLQGEVRFPGEYRIRRGETLSQLLDRAGGLTDTAFPEGAVFLRESLRLREQDQIDQLVRRLQTDLTSLTLASSEGSTLALETGEALLAQLREVEAVGRLVIDLESIATDPAERERLGNLELRDGDQLFVPKQAQAVTVLGETQQNTSHLFRTGLTRDDYIEMSGGLTRRADPELIYVVRANGAVETGARSRWFGRKDASGGEIRPGDTIVVPLEIDRIRPLTFWSQATQILYQVAIAVAAVNSF